MLFYRIDGNPTLKFDALIREAFPFSLTSSGVVGLCYGGGVGELLEPFNLLILYVPVLRIHDILGVDPDPRL
jgi:hypothetical protein